MGSSRNVSKEEKKETEKISDVFKHVEKRFYTSVKHLVKPMENQAKKNQKQLIINLRKNQKLHRKGSIIRIHSLDQL